MRESETITGVDASKVDQSHPWAPEWSCGKEEEEKKNEKWLKEWLGRFDPDKDKWDKRLFYWCTGVKHDW